MQLHTDVVTAPGASPTRALLFLHGILGSGGNLRSHARTFVTARPEYLAVLVDLRAHGESLGVEGADTVAIAAEDVAQTTRLLAAPVTGVVGHSFGGKVALALAQAHPELKDVMTLDSAPGPRLDARGSEATVRVITMLQGMHGPWDTREAFVQEVESHGQSRGLAQWLAMNLARRPEGFQFRLELTRILALLDDYFAVDLWPLVEQAAQTRTGPRFHLVIGTKSKVYEHDDRVRAQTLESESNGYVTVDLLDAGHWVHVDDPRGVSEVIARRFT
jgi:pimeloyl-ACP methyl ester carboxylesterase